MVNEFRVLAQVVLRLGGQAGATGVAGHPCPIRLCVMASVAEVRGAGSAGSTAAAGASAPEISFRDVGKQFPAAEGGLLEVLRGVSFEVAAGEIVAIVGPSGSGKSTLLNMAAGLLMPDQGQVAVLGLPTSAAVDWGRVGYMFQDDRLLPWRGAVPNVALAAGAGRKAAA